MGVVGALRELELLACMFLFLYRGLCDFRSVGKLNLDQFALAMHLISQKLKGVDVPAKLPPNMLTPLIRRRSLVVHSSCGFYLM